MLRLKSKTAPKTDLYVVVASAGPEAYVGLPRPKADALEVFHRTVAARPSIFEPHGNARLRVMRQSDCLKSFTARYALEAE